MKTQEKPFKAGQKMIPYIETRTKLIAEILNGAKVHYKKDKAMLSGVIDLTAQLEMVSPQEGTAFVQGMWGFCQWLALTKSEDRRLALTTLIHDLGEFARNRNEKWFCPRTSRYSKYLTGASESVNW